MAAHPRTLTPFIVRTDSDGETEMSSDPNPADRQLSIRRKLGFDDNPMRRRSDRVQAWARLVVIGLFVLFTFGGVFAGLTTYGHELAREQADRQYGYQITGRVLETASRYSDSNSGSSSTSVRVGWRDTQDRWRTDRLTLAHAVRAGERLRLWIDAEGEASTTAPGHDRTIALSVFKGLGITLFLAFFLLLGYCVLTFVLDHRRLTELDVEWDTVEPRWRRELP